MPVSKDGGDSHSADGCCSKGGAGTLLFSLLCIGLALLLVGVPAMAYAPFNRCKHCWTAVGRFLFVLFRGSIADSSAYGANAGEYEMYVEPRKPPKDAQQATVAAVAVCAITRRELHDLLRESRFGAEAGA
jgi:hypothetical protein